MAFKMKSFEQVSYSMINWMNNTVNTLTDFTVGSKIRTLMETVALEIEELYYRSYKAVSEAQVEGVYEAFDFSRKPATRSTGIITVIRDSADPTQDHVIGIGLTVSTNGTETESSVIFETTEEKTILTQTGVQAEEITFMSSVAASVDTYTPVAQRFMSSITLITGESPVMTYTLNTHYSLYKDPSGVQDHIKWIGGQSRPDNNTLIHVSYKPLSVDIPIACVSNGVVGNVAAGKIVKLTTGSDAISSVNNFYSLVNGADTESDSVRKIRFSNFIAGLSRGTIAAIRYALFNNMVSYTVYSATILENQPTPGFIQIYVADSSGSASDAMVSEAATVVDAYRGAGITVIVAKPTVVNIDVYCYLRIRSGYNKETVLTQVFEALTSHLSGYKFLDDTGYATVYLTTLDYVVKTVNPDAIIEADISFKRATEAWNAPTSAPLTNKKIDDIIPELSSTRAEIFKAGNVQVYYYD